MRPTVKNCMLLNEQRSIILQGIYDGKKEYKNINSLLPDMTTRTYDPRLQYDLVNTHVEKMVLNNPHTKLKVYRKKAGFHPYIVVHDTIRNIFVLVSKLPNNRYIYNPSAYRGDFASSNIERLLYEGVSKEDLMSDKPYQISLPIGLDSLPFGIIISYDGNSDTVYEGAIKPDQEDWIYKEEITDSLIQKTDDIIPLNQYNLSELEPKLKDVNDENQIIVKLKNKSSSS